LWYSGKKKDSGGNVQALFYPGGLPMRVSDVLSGNVHDLAAARENVLPVLREYTDTMPCLADCGYEGAGHGVLTPVRKPKGVAELDVNARTRDMLRHREPQPDRPDRTCGPCPGAIRAQATHVKVAEKTSLNHAPASRLAALTDAGALPSAARQAPARQK
jgi:hypothetical protein